MAHAQKPDFIFQRKGRVRLNRLGGQFSWLLAAEVCASAGSDYIIFSKYVDYSLKMSLQSGKKRVKSVDECEIVYNVYKFMKPESEAGITSSLSKGTYADLSEDRSPDRYLRNCWSKPTRGKENRWRRIGLFPYLITYAWFVCQMLFAYGGELCWQSTANRIACLPFPPPPPPRLVLDFAGG